MKHLFIDADDRLKIGWQVAIFAAIALLFLLSTGQLTTPFIAGDDWPFLLPAAPQGGTPLPWANTLAEGRWVNYLWYTISVHLTPLAANWLFTAAYTAMTVAVAAIVSRTRLFLLCALALFFSPMFAELSLWPSSIFSAVALGAIAATLIAWRGDRLRVSLPILFAATYAMAMAYPPLASILLLCAVARRRKPTLRSNTMLALAFLVAFAASVLTAYALNGKFHGYFGVKVASWRHPDPLRNVTDLASNLSLAASNWQGIAHRFLLPMTCGGLAGAIVLLRKQTRVRGIAILFALVLSFCVAIGITVIAGVGDPARSVPWLWVAACFLCALLASESSRIERYLAIATLAVLVIFGGTASWRNYRTYRPIAAYVAAVSRAISKGVLATTPTRLVVAGSMSHVPMSGWVPGGHWPEPKLDWAMWKRYGVALDRCDYDTCTAARKYVLAHGIQQPTVISIEDKPVLVLNDYPVDEVLRNYPSIQQEAALHLKYPVFLRWGPTTVRVTPFFPDTSKAPVSIALPSSARGYTLTGPTACAYPVEYTLSDTYGTLHASGRYRSPNTAVLDLSAQRRGSTILSLRMEDGAKNNYNCNLVIRENTAPNRTTHHGYHRVSR